MKKFKPLRDKLIVRVKTGEEKTAGGIIYVVEGSREAMAREEGVVLSLGKSVFYDTDGEDLKAGDLIAFARYAGKSLVKYEDGHELRAIRDIDVLCVIEEGESK